MFGEAGLPEPTKDWTWDDVLERGRLTRPEKGQWGINGNFGHGTFFSSVWANNGEVLNQGPQQDLFAGPEGVEAWSCWPG